VAWIWGYSNVSAWLAALTARFQGLIILVRGEAILDVPRSWWRRLLKEIIVRTFLKMVNGVAYSCEANRKYYQHYGVRDKALFFSPCAVDNRFFQAQASSLDPEVCKKSLGLAVDQPVLLFVGRLDQRKRPLDLIRAVKSFTNTLKPALLLVGDGPLRSDLEDFCKINSLSNVHFLGFRNQTELPLFYSAADIVLVMSSSDPSPKVLNEAMNFGVPVVVSDRVGTAGDLVVDGWNGFIVPFGDINAIRTACESILTNPVLRQQMHDNALVQINDWSFEKAAKAVERWLLNTDS
jgi:glycosyltransferase involved in cell wall biosynthesis